MLPTCCYRHRNLLAEDPAMMCAGESPPITCARDVRKLLTTVNLVAVYAKHLEYRPTAATRRTEWMTLRRSFLASLHPYATTHATRNQTSTTYSSPWTHRGEDRPPFLSLLFCVFQGLTSRWILRIGLSMLLHRCTQVTLRPHASYHRYHGYQRVSRLGLVAQKDWHN